MEKLFEKFQHYLLAEKYVSQNTMQAYTRDIQQFLDFLKDTTSVRSFRKIIPQHVKDYLKYLKQEKKIGPKSASRKLSALKTIAQYLARYHNVNEFTQGVAFPKLPKQLPKHLTEEQIQDILMAAAKDGSVIGQRNKIMICLLYTCGIRVSELVALEKSNVQFDEGFLQVYGKGDKERIVPIPPEMIQLLQNYLSTIHPLLTEAVKGPPTEYLFPVVYGKKIEPITRQALWNVVRKIAREAGLVHSISPHVLRHSLATHLLKKGANLRVLQMLLGHEKLNTVQVYTHLDVSHLQDLYDSFHPRAKREAFDEIGILNNVKKAG